MPKISERRGARCQLRVLRGISFKCLPQRARNFHQRTRIQKFGNGKHSGGNRQSRKPLLGIRERTKAKLGAGAQITGGFSHQHEFRIERRNILLQRQALDHAASRRTSGIAADNFFQLIEFQNLSCRARHESLNATKLDLIIVARLPVGISAPTQNDRAAICRANASFLLVRCWCWRTKQFHHRDGDCIGCDGCVAPSLRIVVAENREH